VPIREAPGAEADEAIAGESRRGIQHLVRRPTRVELQRGACLVAVEPAHRLRVVLRRQLVRPQDLASAAEGVAADAQGNVYGAEVGPRALKKYVKR